MVRYGLLVGACMVAAPAFASETPLYQAAPAWIKAAAPIDAAKLDAASPVIVLFDNQQRLEGGQVWSYVDTATRIASPEMLTQAGTLTASWQPDQGDLIVHRVQILRGGETIDVLAGGKRFTVLRREERLERLEMNGVLTATLAVEGLRLGDVLRLTISTTNKDAALGGKVQTIAQLPVAPVRAGLARIRLTWPEKDAVQWKTYAEGAKPLVTTADGYREVTFDGILPKQPELPNDAPVRFVRPPIVEATTFASWSAVSQTMAPLYATAGLIPAGSPLATEVARIAAATPDPLKRAALALELVQGKIRYLFNGMAGGNYTPQKPADTWSLRYGDCKAKTLLLLAILHELKIDAEPATAPAQAGDVFDTRLPSAAAFDHIIVKANVAGETLWLDGTMNGVTLADIRDVPTFRHVLPIRAAGSDLVAVPFHPDARPEVEAAVEYDQRAGVSLPTLVTVTMKVRGQSGSMMNLVAQQATPDQKRDMVQKVVGNIVSNARLTDQSLAYDPVTGVATVTGRGIVSSPWGKERGRWRTALDGTMSDINFTPDRGRAAWRAIPVAVGPAKRMAMHTRLLLPQGGKGFVLEGDQSLDEVIAGRRIVRKSALAGDVVTIDDELATVAPEIAPADIPATRARVALAKTRTLQAAAPVDLPSRFQVVAEARRSGALKPILAAYAKSIANDPEDVAVYINRASFLANTYDRPAAIVDLTKALSIEPTIDTYLWRAGLYEQGGEKAKQQADLDEALKLDPSSFAAINTMARYRLDAGDKDAAIAMIQERIDAGGKEAGDYMAAKADLLARAGDGDGALVAIDEAVKDNPGSAQLLNSRCWIKGTLNVQLDTALKDCTRSIELSESRVSALDSRAMVYYRMNRFDDALADLTAALDDAPELAASLYMRGIIRGKQGAAPESKADLASARLISPLIDRDYSRFGIKP